MRHFFFYAVQFLLSKQELPLDKDVDFIELCGCMPRIFFEFRSDAQGRFPIMVQWPNGDKQVEMSILRRNWWTIDVTAPNGEAVTLEGKVRFFPNTVTKRKE